MSKIGRILSKNRSIYIENVNSSNIHPKIQQKYIYTQNQQNQNRNLEVDGCQSNLYVMLKQLVSFFIYFTTSFACCIFDEPTVL